MSHLLVQDQLGLSLGSVGDGILDELHVPHVVTETSDDNSADGPELHEVVLGARDYQRLRALTRLGQGNEHQLVLVRLPLEHEGWLVPVHLQRHLQADPPVLAVVVVHLGLGVLHVVPAVMQLVQPHVGSVDVQNAEHVIAAELVLVQHLDEQVCGLDVDLALLEQPEFDLELLVPNRIQVLEDHLSLKLLPVYVDNGIGIGKAVGVGCRQLGGFDDLELELDQSLAHAARFRSSHLPDSVPRDHQVVLSVDVHGDNRQHRPAPVHIDLEVAVPSMKLPQLPPVQRLPQADHAVHVCRDEERLLGLRPPHPRQAVDGGGALGLERRLAVLERDAHALLPGPLRRPRPHAPVVHGKRQRRHGLDPHHAHDVHGGHEVDAFHGLLVEGVGGVDPEVDLLVPPRSYRAGPLTGLAHRDARDLLFRVADQLVELDSAVPVEDVDPAVGASDDQPPHRLVERDSCGVEALGLLALERRDLLSVV
eukprot:765791-Hanusia_phi.AAC.3